MAMKLNKFQKYYNLIPSKLGDQDYIKLVSYFKFLAAVEKPMVSLVIPVFRAENTLLAHIISLMELKTILPYEVIFIDNNANNETLSILKNLGAFVIKETRQGITHARQKGLEVARGEVVCTMDPDTLYEPHYIDKMALPFFLESKLVLCYSNTISYEDGMTLSSKMRFRNYLKTKYFRYRLSQGPLKRMKFVRAACLAFRREPFLKIGYRTDLKAVAGCDDGIVAIDLNNSGTSKYIATTVYTALPPAREPGKPFPFCNEKYHEQDVAANKGVVLNY